MQVGRKMLPAVQTEAKIWKCFRLNLVTPPRRETTASKHPKELTDQSAATQAPPTRAHGVGGYVEAELKFKFYTSTQQLFSFCFATGKT